MKKGFTLIELLAVIIILAIIALIATPIILDVIDDAKKSAAKSEAAMIVSGVNNYCAAAKMQAQMTNATNICEDGVTTEEVEQMVDLGNAKVNDITFADGRVTSLEVESNGKKVIYDGSTFEIDGEVIPEPEKTVGEAIDLTNVDYVLSNTDNIIIVTTPGVKTYSTYELEGKTYTLVSNYLTTSDLVAGNYYFDDVRNKAVLKNTIGTSKYVVENNKIYTTFVNYGEETELANWNYTVDEANKQVVLKYFNPSTVVENVEVYAYYVHNGNIYNTKFASAPDSETKTTNWMFNASGAVVNANADNNKIKQIKTIKFDSGIDTSSLTSMYMFFRDCVALENIDGLNNIDVSHVGTFMGTFLDCISLTSLDLRGWNTGSATSMQGMFSGNTGYDMQLTEIKGIEDFDVSNVTLLRSMFQNETKLTTLDLSKWNTASAEDLTFMFAKAHHLSNLNVSTWNTSSVLRMEAIFMNTGVEIEYKELDISGWNTSKVENMQRMFSNPENNYSYNKIYVGTGWNTSSVTDSANMFYGCTNLRNFDASVTDKTNANTSATGYLTLKTN